MLVRESESVSALWSYSQACHFSGILPEITGILFWLPALVTILPAIT